MKNVLRDVIVLQLRVEQQKTSAVPSMASKWYLTVD